MPKETVKSKNVNVPGPKRIDLSKMKRNQNMFAGGGQSEVQGKGAATRGTKYNNSSSGVR
jgi:hypothetical protein|tara:strand:+ start:370 stop:549 length:180 start_codon:yes stop_codon:yes gene_type:complete